MLVDLKTKWMQMLWSIQTIQSIPMRNQNFDHQRRFATLSKVILESSSIICHERKPIDILLGPEKKTK